MRRYKKRVKLLIIVDAWFPLVGGGQIHVWELSKELTKLGYEIEIFTRDLGKWRNTYPHIKVIRVGSIQKFNNIFGRLSFLIKAFFYSLKSDYDILSLQAFSPGLIAPLIKLLKPKKPIVFTAHGTGYKIAGLGISLSFLEEVVFYKIKYDLEISVAKKTFIKKPRTKNYKIIPNGVDLERFNKGIKKRNCVNKILYYGRLVEDKGVDILIKAFRRLNNSNLKLFIVGDGDKKIDLMGLAEGLDVQFYGMLDGKDLIDKLHESDLLVLPSRVEGQPLRLLEAWAAKLPVLATDVGDNAVYLRNGVNGFLTKPNEKSLVKSLKCIINSKELYKISEEGYLAVKKYSWENIARETFEEYNNLL